MMETQIENGIWKRIGEKLKIFREDLKKDSVVSNPQKPVDCCNPPVASKMDIKPKE